MPCSDPYPPCNTPRLRVDRAGAAGLLWSRSLDKERDHECDPFASTQIWLDGHSSSAPKDIFGPAQGGPGMRPIPPSLHFADALASANTITHLRHILDACEYRVHDSKRIPWPALQESWEQSLELVKRKLASIEGGA